MHLRRRRAQYHRLTTGEHDNIIELEPSNVVSHDGFRKVHVHETKRKDRSIRQLTIRETFSTALDIRTRLPLGSKRICAHSNHTQQIARSTGTFTCTSNTRVELTTSHRARCLVWWHHNRT
ncbi:hypothetical protein TNCV_659691 [Trichonephila clavipes]|nr:hypothetical protein TNCV_659691 [Trichonephila clavipes]